MENLNLDEGFHEDVPEDHYHADMLCREITLSRGVCVEIANESPAHGMLKHPRLNPDYRKSEPTEAMQFGSAGHSLILGRGQKIAVMEADSWRGKEAGAFWDKAVEAGMQPMLMKTYDRATKMAVVAKQRISQTDFADKFAAGKSEVVAIFRDAGVLCRCMFDRIYFDESTKRCHVFDIKISSNANPGGESMARHFLSQDWNCQPPFYRRAIEILKPEYAGRIDWTFIVVEPTMPHAVIPVTLDGMFETLGVSKLARGFMAWQECIKTGSWPTFAPTTRRLEAPAFALAGEFGASSFKF